jgi:Mlc titration factor MtfA (ptsG expression regulator)
MFGWLRKRKQRRLGRLPIPPAWVTILEEDVPFYTHLDDVRRLRLQDLLKVFVWEKYWFGAGDLKVTDRMKVMIAAAAVRLVLHLDLTLYDDLTEIIVYPGAFRRPDDDGDGVLLGEAHSWGTVVLSWAAVEHGLKNPCDGHDTASHEFAHVLDRAAGDFNGTPELRATADYRIWGEVMTHHFNRLREGGLDERSVLTNYGATNEAEFFAVATESFFEKPWQMKKHTPQLYDELQRFYGFDPANAPMCGRRDD